MQCVILAGGLGTRMWPDTRAVPKTLLEVAGRPFAEWQLEWLAGAGVTSVVYCIGHLGDQIRRHVGTGSSWGLDVTYVDEGTRLRGTAGALRLAADGDALEPDFLVLYGDSWLQVDPSTVYCAHRRSALPAMMTVFENQGAHDSSNVVLDGELVRRYEKDCDPLPAGMRWIDYGLLAFSRGLIVAEVPSDQVAELAPLCSRLAAAGELAAYEVEDRFYEIGSPAGRAETGRLLAGRG